MANIIDGFSNALYFLLDVAQERIWLLVGLAGITALLGIA